MVTQSPKNLSELLEISEITPRIESLAWLTAAQQNPKLAEINPEHDGFQLEITKELNLDLDIPGWISNSVLTKKIPEYHIKWIDDSFRQSGWILKTLTEIKQLTDRNNYSFINYPYTHTANINSWLTLPTHLIEKNRSIAIIDYYTSNLLCDLTTKIDIVNWLENQWKIHTKTDIYFKWLDEENTDKKVEFFKNWLIQKKFFIHNELQPIKSHYDFLLYFDNPVFTDEAKKLFNIEARTAWNQRQRREKQTDRKQCNFVLPTTITKKLEQLRKKHDLTASKIIEILIDSESKHETYIKMRLARNHLLKTPEE